VSGEANGTVCELRNIEKWLKCICCSFKPINIADKIHPETGGSDVSCDMSGTLPVRKGILRCVFGWCIIRSRVVEIDCELSQVCYGFWTQVSESLKSLAMVVFAAVMDDKSVCGIENLRGLGIDSPTR
jgi:hypothetical protein